MSKKPLTHLFLVVSAILSILLAVYLLGNFAWQVSAFYRPQTIDQALLADFDPPDDVPAFSPTVPLVSAEEIGLLDPTNPAPTPALNITPTPEWMTYDGIDLKGQQTEMLFTFTCNGEENIYFEPFQIMPYEEGILDSEAFLVDFAFSVAWEHLDFDGIWIHSGISRVKGALTAYPLQNYLESYPSGPLRTVADFNKSLKDCVIGSELRIKQERGLSVNRIVAAVRIPPEDVPEMSTHVMDLVPYLAEKYPDSGFGELEVPAIILSFCGRQLTGERADPDAKYWTQARIIIGAEPIQ